MTGPSDVRLLSDRQMSAFLTDGVVCVSPDELGAGFHRLMFERARDAYQTFAGAEGLRRHLVILDNLRSYIQEVDDLLQSPTVAGALQGVLGPEYACHPHHFLHEVSRSNQPFHQEATLPAGQRGYYRYHRPNWVTLFYYPQEVNESNGPTEILLGSQYWSTDQDTGRANNREWGDGFILEDGTLVPSPESVGIGTVRRRRVLVPPGSVVITHYDVIHRGTQAQPGTERFMYKFYLFRTADPVAPAWDNRSDEPLFSVAGDELIARHWWHWLRGNAAWKPGIDPEGRVDAVLQATSDDVRMRSAYELGWAARTRPDLADRLGPLLTHGVEAVRRAAAHAIGVAGPVAEGAALAGLADDRAPVRRMAAFACGEARLGSPGVSRALVSMLQGDDEDLTRSNAAAALGHIGRPADGRVDARTLIDRLDRSVEPDNVNPMPGMSRSTVRETVMYALVQLCVAGKLSDDDLSRLAATALVDPDRYVSALSVEIFKRSAARARPAWLAPVVERLDSTRFYSLPLPRNEELAGAPA